MKRTPPNFSAMTQKERQQLPAHIQAILQDDDARRAAHTPDPAVLAFEVELRHAGWREAQGLAGGVDLWKHDAHLDMQPSARPVGLTSTHPVLCERAHARQMEMDPEYRAAVLALRALTH